MAVVAAAVLQGLVAEVSGAAVALVPEAAVALVAQEADLPGALDLGPLAVANQIPPGSGLQRRPCSEAARLRVGRVTAWEEQAALPAMLSRRKISARCSGFLRN